MADGIIEAIVGDRFESYLPDLSRVVEYKQSDIDGFIKMSADMRRSAEAKMRALVFGVKPDPWVRTTPTPWYTTWRGAR